MTTQATYYIIRALVALVAIPFHDCLLYTSPSPRDS